MNVGRSLKATVDYVFGTLGGVVYSGVIAVLLPHNSEPALLAVLAIGIAPPAMLAAIDPRFGSAPFTAVLVVMAPTIAPVSPLESALYRVIEVALGASVGLAVSHLVLPSRAQILALAAAARMLALMARFLPALFQGFVREFDAAQIRPMQDSLGRTFLQLDAVAAEARRERMTSLIAAPDAEPLRRTLLRLRHDLVLIGRAAAIPLPEALRTRLAPALARVSETAADYLRQTSDALLSRSNSPRLQAFEAARESHLAEIAEIRRLGLTRDLPVDGVERIFALGFALEQLHENFGDLARVIETYATPPPAGG